MITFLYDKVNDKFTGEKFQTRKDARQNLRKRGFKKLSNPPNELWGKGNERVTLTKNKVDLF